MPAGTFLFVCNDLDYFLRHRLSIPTKLCASGNKVIVVCGGLGDHAELDKGITFVKSRIDRFSFNVFSDLTLFARLLLISLWSRPQSAQLITLKPAIFGGVALRLARAIGCGPARIVVTIPGLGRLLSESVDPEPILRRTKRRLVLWALKFVSNSNATTLTFENSADRDYIVSEGVCKEGKTAVLKGAGVDPSYFYPARDYKSEGKIKVLFASRLLRSKGLGAFIHAAEISSASNEFDFIVVGIHDPADPDCYDQEELEKHTSIKFLGEERNMPTLLRKVDIVCLPTLYGEGIPRILIEAAATGLPLIATDHPGCKEIVFPSQNGELITSRSEDRIANEIVCALRVYAQDRSLLRQHGDESLVIFQNGGFSEEAINRDLLRILCVS